MVADEPGLIAVLETGARCTTAQLRPPDAENPQWTVVGDPTEGALLVAARKAKIDQALTPEQVVHEIPFDSDRKAMSIVVAESGRRRMMTKGAPEVILGMATAELVDGAAPTAGRRAAPRSCWRGPRKWPAAPCGCWRWRSETFRQTIQGLTRSATWCWSACSA